LKEWFKLKNAQVNVHGNVDQKKLKEATVKFLKAVEKHKRENERESKRAS
jgi:predicted Zn-dependent peptidase